MISHPEVPLEVRRGPLVENHYTRVEIFCINTIQHKFGGLTILHESQFLPPGEFGTSRSMLYFLQPSYWSKRSKRYVEVSSVYEGEVNGTPVTDESVETVSSEFRGKEVIRYIL